MTDLQELYQELILDHNKRPRNRGRLENPDRCAEGYNPLCGDKISVSIEMDRDTIRNIVFEGSGCAISTASASLMTESVKGKTIAQARDLFHRFQSMVTEENGDEASAQGLGKLVVFCGVRKYPARVKCATLAWHTIKAALDDSHAPVTTE